MEKRLRSSLKTSADEFLSSAAKLGFRSAKTSLKSVIHTLNPSSDLVSSLSLSLYNVISQSITSFKNLSESPTADGSKTPLSPSSPLSPPTKRVRRSSRRAKNVSDGCSGKEDDDESKRENVRQNVLESIQIYSHVVLLCVTHPKKVFPPSDLLPAVHELHDNLILFEADRGLLSEIASLCEKWWKEELPGRDSLISQSLPFLLSRSLTLKKKVDVHRVYALREAFTLFDFEDESIEDLKLLLTRCLICPLYLKMEDGRKFLAFLFGLSRQFVKEALAMVRSQIPFGRKSVLEAYADIIFRAWKAVEGESKIVIENEFIQELIELSIHASSSSLAASIRRVLGGFISQRTIVGIEKLLFNLAEPVIFRSLQVANSNVRQNALHLLIDLFPLEDPDATREVKDTLLDRQFLLLEKLLMDECPDVRGVAIEGSCRILRLFWEIIPSSTITKLITKISDDMAHDMCNEVRLSTVNGIIYLLDNPQSHEILKVILPRFGHLIMDSALSIRGATVNLLLQLKDIQNFQFHKVVPLDSLLPTLANDQSVIAQKITKLLLPTYFPSKVTPEEACSRCVTLIKRSPLAGARFCEFVLAEGASLNLLMELFIVLINLALSHEKLSVDQIDGILVAAAHLCYNLASEATYKAALQHEFSCQKLKCLFSAASTGRAQSSVCNIVATIGLSADVLLEECMTVVTNCTGLSDDGDRQAEVRSVHKMMLICNSFDYMFEALASLLQKAAQGCLKKFGPETEEYDLPSGKRRRVKSPVKVSAKSKRAAGKKNANTSTNTFDKDYAIAVGIAWQIKDLLLCDDTRKAMLGSRFLESAFSSLKVISEVSITQSLHCDFMNTYPILAYTSLSLHMSIMGATSNGSKGHCSKTKDWHDLAINKTIDHVLQCTDKLLTRDFGSSSKASLESTHAEKRTCRGKKLKETHQDDPSCRDGGLGLMKQRRMSNTVKILTAILKFVVDSRSMDLISECDERCLDVTKRIVEFFLSKMRQHYDDILQLKDEDLKQTLLCLKSSFTYAAKLLNLVLQNSSEASPPSPEAYNLANNLLNLIISVEEHLGSRYGAILLVVSKPWLPDMILALSSIHSSGASIQAGFRFPKWLLILAELELSDQSEPGSEDDYENRVSKSLKFPKFRELVEMLIQLLRANNNVLDAIGAFLMKGSMVGLENKDFELLFGLLHFVCAKLMKHGNREWRDMKLMPEFLGQIYPQMESLGNELRSSHEKQMLERARALLEPVWRSYIDETQIVPTEADFEVD